MNFRMTGFNDKLKVTTILFAALTFAFYLILIASLFKFISKDSLFSVLFSERTLFSITISVAASLVAVALAVIIGIPAAYALSRYEFPGKKAVDLLLELPMVVSPAAVGAIILFFFNTQAGNFFQTHVQQVVFTFYGIVLAQFTTILGVAIRMIKNGFDEVPKRYEQVAGSLGASSWDAFRVVTLPLCKRSILSSIILSWAKAMGEFGATITVAGTMAMKTETLPIAIYMRLSSADITGAAGLILILLVTGLLSLVAVRWITGGKSYA